MNEKIKELYDHVMYSSYVKTDNNGNDHYMRKTDYELFAELIVRECMDAIIKAHNGHINPKFVIEPLKEHFGLNKSTTMKAFEEFKLLEDYWYPEEKDTITVGDLYEWIRLETIEKGHISPAMAQELVSIAHSIGKKSIVDSFNERMILF